MDKSAAGTVHPCFLRAVEVLDVFLAYLNVSEAMNELAKKVPSKMIV
jgi:hypothetical protein